MQLTLQRKADAASKLAGGVAGATGVSEVSSNIYFMITVSGEGMILAPFRGAGCLGVTIPSTVFVPASLTGKQGVDLEVLVGRNRLVRLYQIEFASGVPLPNSGEAFHRYMDRTRNSGAADGRVVGEPWLLATAFIPNLQGDQTVTLVDKASPERMFCPGGGNGGGGAAPPIYDANNNAEMSNYSHWEGGTAANPNPIRIWSWSGASTAPYSTPDFQLRMEGSVKNLYPSASTSNVLSISTTTPNITKVSGYFYGASSGAPVEVVTSNAALINWGGVSQAPYQQSLYFRQLAKIPGTLLTPGASWYGGQLRAKHELHFSISTGATPLSGAINREIPIQRVSGNPITLDSLVKVNSPVSYQNLYKLKITNSLGSSIRLMPYFSRSLFTDKQWLQTTGFADVEIIKAPAVISTPNECPFQESGSSLSESKTLASGAHCYLYIAIFDPGNLTVTGLSQEKLFLESRVRDSSENEGYVQHPVQPSGGFTSANDGAINTFKRFGAVYSDASTSPNYAFQASNTYGPNAQYFNVSSANLVYADLRLENNKMIRVQTSDVTLPSSFSVDPIELRRKYNGDRVLEAMIVIEGQRPTGSNREVQRMRVPFYPASSLILFAQHAPVAGGAPFSIPSGQKIWFNCPTSAGSFNYNYTTRFKLGAHVVDAPLYSTNSASQVFSYSLSFSGDSAVLSPSSVSGTYTYLNIDGSPNTQGGGWQFECLQ